MLIHLTLGYFSIFFPFVRFNVGKFISYHTVWQYFMYQLVIGVHWRSMMFEDSWFLYLDQIFKDIVYDCIQYIAYKYLRYSCASFCMNYKLLNTSGSQLDFKMKFCVFEQSSAEQQFVTTGECLNTAALDYSTVFIFVHLIWLNWTVEIGCDT